MCAACSSERGKTSVWMTTKHMHDEKEDPAAPEVPLMPASVTFEARPPKAGWWNVGVLIEERDFQWVLWPEAEGRERRRFGFTMELSAECDPIEDLHQCIDDLTRERTAYGKWDVDEEGCGCVFEYWALSHRLMQLRIRKTYRWEEGETFDLLVDKVDFLAELKRIGDDFHRHGGWRSFFLDGS